MSATLKINLRKTLLGSNARAGAVATIIPIGEASDDSLSQSVVIPAGYGAFREVSVPAGRYLVETMLPSGSFVRQQVTVKEHEEREVQLDSGSSNEWMGWQSLVAQSRVPERTGDTAPRVTTLHLRPTMRVGCWKRLARLVRKRTLLTPAEIADALDADLQPPEKAAFVNDRVSSFGYENVPRSIAIVERKGVAEAVMLPVPWRTHEGIARFEIAAPHDPTAPLGLSINDSDFGAMVGYLGSGALPTAQQMLEPTGDLMATVGPVLFGKVRNPFAAVAAAAVLVQAETTGERQKWDDWIDNLATWFPDIPDGEILRGVRRLALARVPADLDDVRQTFAGALRRGLPIFASVARSFVQALNTLVGDQSVDSSELEADGAYAAVRDTMRRVQVRQAFTVLRFEERTR